MTEAAAPAPLASGQRPGVLVRWLGPVLPVLTVVAALIALWYAAAVPMNIHSVLTAAEREEIAVTPPGAAERRDMAGLGLALSNLHVAHRAWAEDRPRLPAPHQVVAEMWDSTVNQKITSRRSLVFHTWVTLSATVAGWAIGTLLGIALAVGIVYSRVMHLSVMPWAIASQTIPILAIAPMIVVVLNSVGIQGLLPKAFISAYLSFFPVVVGMAKGLRAPDAMQLDQMHTWNASKSQVFWRLRLPASMPFLFTSLKIGAAAALVGAIVAELPAGGGQGLGARLLAGSYYGQTIQIWAALFMAAIAAATLVGLIGAAERATLRRMGFGR